ncbi:hypothetical protein CAP48_07705 [Advenella sp. S44]|nr:hypothetical protein CAP48_07705 [Advenella sp. S44]
MSGNDAHQPVATVKQNTVMAHYFGAGSAFLQPTMDTVLALARRRCVVAGFFAFNRGIWR